MVTVLLGSFQHSWENRLLLCKKAMLEDSHGHAPAVDLSVWHGSWATFLNMSFGQTPQYRQTHSHPCSSQTTLPPASGLLHFWQLSARLASLAFGTEVKGALLDGMRHRCPVSFFNVPHGPSLLSRQLHSKNLPCQLCSFLSYTLPF